MPAKRNKFDLDFDYSNGIEIPDWDVSSGTVIPDWDVSPGGTQGTSAPGWSGEGDSVDPETGLPTGTPGSPGAPGSASGPGGMPTWLSGLPQSLLRMLGIGGGAGAGGGAGGGLGGLGALIPLIASIYGGVQARGATEEGRRAMLEANNQARDTVNARLGEMGGAYKPYSDAGAAGLAGMRAAPPSDLASRYRPLGSGRGPNFAQLGRAGR